MLQLLPILLVIIGGGGAGASAHQEAASIDVIPNFLSKLPSLSLNNYNELFSSSTDLISSSSYGGSRQSGRDVHLSAEDVGLIRGSVGFLPVSPNPHGQFIHTTTIVDTTEPHIDHVRDADGTSHPVTTSTAFIVLNNNNNARFSFNGMSIPVMRGSLVRFNGGDHKHHTIIESGSVDLLGPFEGESLRRVGISDSGDGFIPGCNVTLPPVIFETGECNNGLDKPCCVYCNATLEPLRNCGGGDSGDSDGRVLCTLAYARFQCCACCGDGADRIIDERLLEQEFEEKLFPDGHFDDDARALMAGHHERRLQQFCVCPDYPQTLLYGDEECPSCYPPCCGGDSPDRRLAKERYLQDPSTMCNCDGAIINNTDVCGLCTQTPTGSPSKSPVTSDPTRAPVTLDPTGSPTESPVTSDPTGAPVTLDPTSNPTESPESTNPTQSPESTSTTTTTTTEATTTTTPEATTTTTSTTTNDGEDPDKPTLHDAIYSLSKCIHSSSHWNPQTYKAHWAKLVLILADKNNSIDLKVTKAEYAANVLGCPEVSGCYGSVCEEIEEVVSALGDDDEPIRERKLRGHWEDMDCDPWVYPTTDKDAKMLATNPGIWIIGSFLTDEEVDKLAHLYQEYGTNAGDNPCSRFDHSIQCRRITPDNFLEIHGNHEDHEFFMNVKAKVQALWPEFNPVEKTQFFDVPEGKQAPFHYRWQQHGRVATVNIFLTDDDDQGGKYVFPLTGNKVSIVSPKKGMALTWLNVDADGAYTKKAVNGLQGTTPESGNKLVFSTKFVVKNMDELSNMAEAETRTCRNLKGVP